MKNFSLLACLFFIIINESCCKNGNYVKTDLPGVILVPGDGGAQLEARLHKSSSDHIYCKTNSSWFTIWLNYLQMLPGVINCWLSNLKLTYDNETRTTHNPEGVDVRVPQFGNTSTVEYLTDDRLYSYFSYVANTLVSLGYVRNQNLRGAPFDFRKAPNELGPFFESLKQLTEELSESTGGPVVLVAHSMGAPLLNYFLNQQSASWRKHHVHSLISLAGAWGGAVKAIKVFAAGDNLGSVLSALTLREQQRTNPSLAFLLPDPQLWKDEVLMVTPHANYTIQDMKAYFHDLELYDGYQMYLDTKDLLRMTSTSPGVALHCLYGVGIPTVERLVYANGGYFPDYPTLVNGPGDGTVNLRSAALCSQYAKLQSQPVFIETFNKTDHMDILKNTGVLRYVANVVTQEARARHSRRSEETTTNTTSSHSSESQPSSVTPPTSSSVDGALDSVVPSDATISDLGSGKIDAGSRSGITSDEALPLSDADIGAIVASVDDAISERWLRAEDQRAAYQQLEVLQRIEKEMERKKIQAQQFKLTIARLRHRMEEREKLESAGR